MNKKYLILISFTLIFSLFLVACGNSSESVEEQQTDEQNQQSDSTEEKEESTKTNKDEKTKVNFVTNPVGSGYYTLAVGQSQLVTSKSNIELIVQPTQGTRVNPQLVGAREADVSNITTDTGIKAFEGTGDFEQPHPFMRILQAGHSNKYAFIVRKEDDINEMTDLKGKRLTVDFPGVSITRTLADLEFKAYGMDLEKDAGQLLKSESTTTGLNDLVEGKTDAVIASLGGGKILEHNSTKPLQVIPFDPSKENVIQEGMGGMSSEIATKENNQWLEEDQPVIGSPSLLWAHEEMSEDKAYTITKTLLENYEELIAVHNNFKGWTPERAVRKTPIPYHPGAIKYYKEAGLWTDEMEQHQSDVLNNLK